MSTPLKLDPRLQTLRPEPEMRPGPAPAKSDPLPKQAPKDSSTIFDTAKRTLGLHQHSRGMIDAVVPTAVGGVLAIGERVLEASEAFARSYAETSEVALRAVHEDGYADFVDSATRSRVRGTDANDAALRLNVAVYTVAQEGAPPAQIMDRAKARMNDPAFDFDAAYAKMARDPAWAIYPIRVPTENGNVPLDPAQTGALSRSVASAVAPNWASVGRSRMTGGYRGSWSRSRCAATGMWS